METGATAQGLDGNRQYQQIARRALPILVRQAHAGSKIFYAALAAEVGLSNPRNLNYPLGSVGTALEQLSGKWKEKIPAIQCLVVNQSNELPGNGIGWFIRDVAEFKELPLRKRKAIVEGVLADVFSYPRWNEVLQAFGLKPAEPGYQESIDAAAHYRGGGESVEHRALKEYVANHPKLAGLSRRAGPGLTEVALPSGDCLDVFFKHAGVRTAVEVKSHISDRADITRGLFQCVKYRAVLRACISAENSDDSADVVLVLGGKLPGDLKALRNILDVRVIENVKVPEPV